MMLYGNSVSYWLMVRLAVASQAHIEEGSTDRFYGQKIATTEFFAAQILPRNAGFLGAIKADSQSINDFEVEDFYRQ
jgi:hypothetical protein